MIPYFSVHCSRCSCSWSKNELRQRCTSTRLGFDTGGTTEHQYKVESSALFPPTLRSGLMWLTRRLHVLVFARGVQKDMYILRNLRSTRTSSHASHHPPSLRVLISCRSRRPARSIIKHRQQRICNRRSFCVCVCVFVASWRPSSAAWRR